MKLSHFKSLVVFVLCVLPVSAPADTLDGLAGVTVQKPNRSMELDLLCASQAYKLNLQANIEQTGNEISGNWFEREYRQGGKIVGKNRDGNIEARIEGNTVAALVSIQTKADRQAFSMDAPGAWVSQVSIELVRAQR